MSSVKSEKIKKTYLNEDNEYEKFFESIPKEKLNKAVFMEDIPDLSYKHAYRIDKRADLNNLCFDCAYHKLVPFYRIPDASYDDKNKKMKRKAQIKEAAKKRYFGRFFSNQTITPDDSDQLKTSSFHLSENLKLYFELKSLEETKINVNLTGDYNKYLHENPKDVSKWLEFIEYQDVSTSKQEANEGQYKRKLAIFEKAVEKNENNLKICLEFLKFRASNSETGLDTVQKIETEFQRLILQQLNRSNQSENGFFSLFYLWYEYLRFMTSLRNLNSNRVKKIVQKFFQFFLADVYSVIDKQSNSKTKCLFVTLIFHLIRFYCKFLIETGYDEKVIGIYQALIDFNFTNLENLNINSIKNLLEVYYETNLPKFGEQYSRGWYSCLENRDDVFKNLEENADFVVSSRYEHELDGLEQNIIYTDFNELRVEHKWLILENLRAKYNWYPFYPQIQAGESADDCIDSDRLIKFDDDLNFLLVNISSIFDNKDEANFIENFRFKLISQYYESFNMVSINHETYADSMIDDEDDESGLNVNKCLKSMYSFEDEDGTNDVYFKYVNDKLLNSSNRTIFDNYSMHKNKNLIENFIQFNRLIIKQAIELAKTKELKERLFLLKWSFEFNLWRMYEKYDYLSEIFSLTSSEFKENFLSELKVDLSINENRSSISLWSQYAILKYYLANTEQHQPNECFKEIRKIFEMLFKLPTLNRETTLNICLTYIELELGIYKRIFNIKQAYVDSVEINFELTNFGLYDYFKKLTELNQLSKKNLIQMISNYCLDSSSSKTTNASLKINIKSGTRELLVDKELEQNYYMYINQTNNKKNFAEISLYHKLYSYYLMLKGNIDKLLKINDEVLRKEHLLKSSDYCEFYINLLNYLHYNVNKLDKSAYKTRLFHFIQFLVKENLNKNKFLTQNLNITLQYTLLKYKIELFDKLFCTQLIEVNDLDFIMTSYLYILNKHKLYKYLYQASLTLISSDLYRFNKIRNNLKRYDEEATTTTVISSFGFHNQLRKRFEQMLDYLPRSATLWSLYFQFEYLHAKDISTNKLVYIYYQAIRNLPFSKVFLFF